jgi:hypothetical protein
VALTSLYDFGCFPLSLPKVPLAICLGFIEPRELYIEKGLDARRVLGRLFGWSAWLAAGLIEEYSIRVELVPSCRGNDAMSCASKVLLVGNWTSGDEYGSV